MNHHRLQLYWQGSFRSYKRTMRMRMFTMGILLRLDFCDLLTDLSFNKALCSSASSYQKYPFLTSSENLTL